MDLKSWTTCERKCQEFVTVRNMDRVDKVSTDVEMIDFVFKSQTCCEQNNLILRVKNSVKRFKDNCEVLKSIPYWAYKKSKYLQMILKIGTYRKFN